MTDSLLDFSDDIQNDTAQDDAAQNDTPNAFAALGLDDRIVTILSNNDITSPTPIQTQAIPLLLKGKDLIACAPTGTGKTAAFLLPSIQRLLTPGDLPGRGARVVVLTPTRELAQQVSKAAIMLAGKLPRTKTVCVTGGEPFRDQLRNIGMPHEILVATPGRLLDHISRGRLDLSRVETFILDEADRMLDMGFSEDVQAIGEALPAGHQTICFSATFDESVRAFAAKMLSEPEWLEVAPEKPRHETIAQQVHYADGMDHKRALLQHWLTQDELGQAVVFTATKRDAEELAMTLRDAGLSADALHGDMVQRQRTRMVQRLRKGDTQILVATDVAARGIDVPGITHVFNFDLPKFAEDYVHRIGRTGRAGRSGNAISFVGKADVPSLGRIEKLLNLKINITEIEGLEPRFKPTERRGGFGGRGGYGGGRGRGGFGGGRREGGYGERREGGFAGGRNEGGYGQRREAGSYGQRNEGGFGQRREGTAGEPRREGGYGQRREGGFAQRNEGGYGQRREGGFAPRGDRFDSRTDNRYGDNRNERRHGGEERGNRYERSATTHHHGQDERRSFRDRDDRGGFRGDRDRQHAPRHDRTDRHH